MHGILWCRCLESNTYWSWCGPIFLGIRNTNTFSRIVFNRHPNQIMCASLEINHSPPNHGQSSIDIQLPLLRNTCWYIETFLYGNEEPMWVLQNPLNDQCACTYIMSSVKTTWTERNGTPSRRNVLSPRLFGCRRAPLDELSRRFEQGTQLHVFMNSGLHFPHRRERNVSARAFVASNLLNLCTVCITNGFKSCSVVWVNGVSCCRYCSI